MKKQILVALAAILIGVLIVFASGAAGAPGGGPPGGGGAPSGGGGAPGGGGAGGFVAPSPNKKNTEWSYNGLVVNVTEDYIEIQNSPVRPKEEWWRALMKIDVGEDTQVTRLGTSLADLKIGQQVQVTGIFAKEGLGLPTEYLTTNYWGYYGRDVHHGTIEIVSDDTWKMTEHQIWVGKENARRQEYGLLQRLGEAK